MTEHKPSGFYFSTLALGLLMLSILLSLGGALFIVTWRSADILSKDQQYQMQKATETTHIALEQSLLRSERMLGRLKQKLESSPESDYSVVLRNDFHEFNSLRDMNPFTFLVLNNMQAIIASESDSLTDIPESFFSRLPPPPITASKWSIICNEDTFTCIVYSLPIYSAETGRQKAVLNGGICLDDNYYLLSQLRNFTGIEKHVIVYKGQIITSSLSSRIASGQTPNPNTAEFSDVSFAINSFPFLKSDEIKVFSFYSSSALLSLKESLSNDISVLLLLAIIVGLITSFLFSKFLTHPINQLMQYAQSIAARSNKVEISSSAIFELNQVASLLQKTFASLLDREKNLEVTLQSIGDGVIVTDTLGLITKMNPVAEKLTGYSFEEAKGLALTSIFNIFSAKTGRPLDSPVEKVLATGKVAALANHTVLKSRQGLEYQISNSAAPITTDENEIIGVILVFSDVTNDYLIRQDLKLSEEKFRSIVESAPMGIFIYTLNNLDQLILTDFNPAADKLLNTDNSAKVGKTIEEAFPDHARTEAAAKIKNAIIKEESWHTNNLVYDDGDIMGVFEISVFKIAPRKAATLFNNITKRKKAEKELHRIQKLQSIGTLAGGLAHDFNNILTGVFGNIEMVKLNLSESHISYPYVKRAFKALTRARHLTQQLLTFAKGGAPLFEKIYLDQTIPGLVEFDLSGSNVKAEICLADDLKPVKADRSQLSLVIANLLINAREAMPDGGKILIEADNCSDEADENGNCFVRLKITDLGCGIPQDKLSSIFDPYFSTKETGSGLGLAIAYSIINKHNGKISVTSIVESGTSFTILLPVDNSESVERTYSARSTEDQMEAESYHILVMEDEEIVREITRTMLESCGYSVDLSCDGAEAIEAYSKAMNEGTPYDIILMDLTIAGGMGGKEALIKLRKIDPNVRAIVYSGYSTDDAMSNYTEYGFKGRLSKPFQLHELRSEIKRALTD